MPVAIVLKLGWLWLRTMGRPFGVAVASLSVVFGTMTTILVVMRAPAVPDALGLITIWVSLMPELAGVVVPLALLYASISASNEWQNGGNFAALSASGVTVRTLLPLNLAVGAMVAIAVGVGTNGFGPMGRSQVRVVLNAAVFIEASPIGRSAESEPQGPDSTRSAVPMTTNERVSWAAASAWGSDGGDGRPPAERGEEVRSLQNGLWAREPTVRPRGGFVNPNAGRSNRELWSDIRQLERAGKDASAERLEAYKRNTKAAMSPLMLLIGLPLGALGRSSAGLAGAVWVSLWALQRVGDQAAFSIGPSGAALVPLVVATCATWLLWVRWRAA